MDALVGIMIAVAGAVGIVLFAVAVAMIRSMAQTRHSQQVVPVHDVKVVAEDGRQYAHDPDAYRDWFFSRARTQVSQLAGGVRNDRPFVANMRAGHVVPDEALLHSLYDVQDSRVLGKGMDGKVVRVVRRSDGLALAMKTIRLPCDLDEAMADSLQQEVDILRQLDHPNVVRLYDTFFTPTHLHIVMEVCSGGDLHAALARQPTGRYREREACEIMAKLLSAICYCHSESVVHRDVKLENVLLETRVPGADIKLIDFGLGAVQKTKDAKMTLVAGTPYYVSPEVLDGSYDQSCDVWGAGVIAFMLMSGRPPFDGDDDHEILAAVRSGEFRMEGREWHDVSDSARDFVRSILVVNPAERPTALQALAHPWIMSGRPGVTAHTMSLVSSVLRQLRRFKRYPLFKRRVLMAIAHNLPREALDPVRRAFNVIDADLNGYIDAKELRHACAAYLSATEVEEIFQAIDVDGKYVAPRPLPTWLWHSHPEALFRAFSGRLEYGEFLAAAVERRIYAQNIDLLDRAFDKLDVDGTGVVTAGNLAVILGSEYTRGKTKMMIADADANRDGRVAREEFHRMLLMSPRSQSHSTSMRPSETAEFDTALGRPTPDGGAPPTARSRGSDATSNLQGLRSDVDDDDSGEEDEEDGGVEAGRRGGAQEVCQGARVGSAEPGAVTSAADGDESGDSLTEDGRFHATVPAQILGQGAAAPPLLRLTVAPPAAPFPAPKTPPQVPLSLFHHVGAADPGRQRRGGSFHLPSTHAAPPNARGGGSFRVHRGAEPPYMVPMMMGGPSPRSHAGESRLGSEAGAESVAQSQTAQSQLSRGPPMAVLDRLAAAAAASPGRGAPSPVRSDAANLGFTPASPASVAGSGVPEDGPVRPRSRSFGFGGATAGGEGEGRRSLLGGFEQAARPGSLARRRPRLSSRARRYTLDSSAGEGEPSPSNSGILTPPRSSRKASEDRSGAAGSGVTPPRRPSGGSRVSAGPPQLNLLLPNVVPVRSRSGSLKSAGVYALQGMAVAVSASASGTSGRSPSRTPAPSRRGSGATDAAQRSLGPVPEERSVSNHSVTAGGGS